MRVGLTQLKLAKGLGVSDKTVSAYESGRAIPPAPVLAKIAKVTNYSLDEFFKPIRKNVTMEALDKKIDKLIVRVEALGQQLGELVKNEKEFN